MREMKVDMFSCPGVVACITTNGETKKNGLAVMGKGIAKLYADAYPQIQRTLGVYLKLRGNHVQHLGTYGDQMLFSFPTKHSWRDKSDIDLIEQSAKELVHMVKLYDIQCPVLIPRPGCNNGQLDWEAVKPRLEKILKSDQYIIVSQ